MLVIKNHTYLGTEYGLTDEELSEANVLQIVYQPDWLDKMIVKGRITEANKERILQMAELLEATYPGLWDIQVSKSRWKYKLDYENISGYGAKEFTESRTFHQLCFDIIIKFPEVKIKNTNSSSKFHLIKDLYVKFQYQQVAQAVQCNCVYTEQDFLNKNPEIMKHAGFYQPFKDFNIGACIYGLRETLSEKEFRANYHHSHLSTDPNMRWSSFCLGTGEIGQTLLLLRERFTPELFQMIIYQLESYVAWESIEGRPYKQFIVVNSRSGGVALDNPVPIGASLINNFLDNVRYHWNELKEFYPNTYIDKKPEFHWKITNNKAELILDEQVDKFLKIYGNRGRDYQRGLVYYQDTEGKYYDATNGNNIPTPIDYNNLTKNTIVFRGEVKGFKVYAIQEESVISSELILHPKLKEVLKQKLEAYGNISRVRESISQRANQIILTRRTAKQDQISV